MRTIAKRSYSLDPARETLQVLCMNAGSDTPLWNFVEGRQQLGVMLELSHSHVSVNFTINPQVQFEKGSQRTLK